jgi:hypothetical protein
VSTVVYWLADRTGCGQYRCLMPGDALRERGHTVHADERITLEWIDSADVIVGQRIGKDGPSTLWQDIARSKDRPERLVYELDDDVFALVHETSNPNHTTWPALLGNVSANLACSDAVTVSTDRLAEVVSEHTSAPVFVVPNAVPDSLLTAPTPYPARHVLGWSGSATHDGDWAHGDWAHGSVAYQVLDWLATSRSAEGWYLRTVGAYPAPLVERAHQYAGHVTHVHSSGTNGLPEYYKRLRRWFGVGLAPLAPTEFNESKSDLRLLELAALGIPWLASNFGPYASCAEARGGLRVDDNRGWHQQLTAVAGDEDMRRELRMQGRVWAATRTISAVLPQWEAALGLTE